MFFLLKGLKKENSSNNQKSYLYTSGMDKFLIWMSIPYLFMFLGSFFVKEDHGTFFDYIGTVALTYLLVVSSSYLSKTMPHDRLFTNLSFGALTFLLFFAQFGLYVSLILAVIMMVISHKIQLKTNVITGSIIGYWMVLWFISSLEYSLFKAIANGFQSTIVEVWTITWNVVDYNVYHDGLNFFGIFFVLVMGLLYSRFHYNEENETEVEIKGREEIQKQNEALFQEATSQKLEDRIKNKRKPEEVILNKNESNEENKQEVTQEVQKENKQDSKQTRSRRNTSNKKPSKQFFNIDVPTTSKKMKDAKEKILRKLSK